MRMHLIPLERQPQCNDSLLPSLYSRALYYTMPTNTKAGVESGNGADELTDSRVLYGLTVFSKAPQLTGSIT